MITLRFVWDPFNFIGNVENQQYPDGVQFTGEDKKPSFSFDFDGLNYLSTNPDTGNMYTDLQGNSIVLNRGQVTEVRQWIEGFTIAGSDIDTPTDTELQAAVVFYAKAELRRTDFLMESDVLDTLPEKAELKAFRVDLNKIINDPANNTTLTIDPKITALYTRYNLDYSYLVEMGVTLRDISDSMTDSIADYIAKAEAAKDIEIADLIDVARANAAKIEADAQTAANATRKFADDYAKSVYDSVQSQQEEDNRRLVVNRLFTQAGIISSDVSKSDGLIVNDYILNNSFVEPGLTGVYGTMPEGNNVFDCLGLDHTKNKTEVVMNQHMRLKTLWNTTQGRFDPLNPPTPTPVTS